MKRRVPLQVAPEFRNALRKLQGEFILKGQSKSLRDITLDIVRSGMLNVEQIKQEITLKMDKRNKYV